LDGQNKVTIHLFFPEAEARKMALEKIGAIEAGTKPWRASQAM